MTGCKMRVYERSPLPDSFCAVCSVMNSVQVTLSILKIIIECQFGYYTTQRITIIAPPAPRMVAMLGKM